MQGHLRMHAHASIGSHRTKWIQTLYFYGLLQWCNRHNARSHACEYASIGEHRTELVKNYIFSMIYGDANRHNANYLLVRMRQLWLTEQNFKNVLYFLGWKICICHHAIRRMRQLGLAILTYTWGIFSMVYREAIATAPDHIGLVCSPHVHY